MFFVLSLLIIISPSIRWVSIQQIWAFRVDVGPKCYSQSIRTSWEWSTNSISIDAGMQCPPLISSIIIRVFSSPLCTSYDVPTLTGPGSVHQTVPYHEYVHFTTLKNERSYLKMDRAAESINVHGSTSRIHFQWRRKFRASTPQGDGYPHS